jgi:hypothetical protein
MKGNRDKIVNNQRNHLSHNHVDDQLSTDEKSESDMTCPLWSEGYETEDSTLTAEGTGLQLRSVS